MKEVSRIGAGLYSYMLDTSIYDSIISDLAVNREVKIGGLWGSSALHLVAQLYSQLQPGTKQASLLFQSQDAERTFLLITNDIESVESAFDDLSTFLALSPKKNDNLIDNILICPAEEKDSNGELTSKSIQEKLLFLKILSSQKNKIVI